MGASDPSRLYRSLGPTPALFLALVFVLLYLVQTSPSIDDSQASHEPLQVSGCDSDINHSPAQSDVCGDHSLPVQQGMTPVAKQTAPTQDSNAGPDSGQPEILSASEPGPTEPAIADGTARIKFSAACQTGGLDDDLRCIADRRRREYRLANVDDSGEQDDPGPAISGRVLDEDGFGVAEIGVLAMPSYEYSDETIDADPNGGSGPRQTRIRTMTDSLGFYRFKGLADGEYNVATAAVRGYQSASISVRAGVSYADLVLARQQTIEVIGQVQSTDGEPLEDVIVLPVVIGAASGTTDRDGLYRLPLTLDPRAGAVTLRFQLPGFNETYATVAAASLNERNSIEVNARMEPVGQWTTVSGVVTSSDGAVLGGRSVRLRHDGQLRMYQSTTDGNGEFVFPAVEAEVDYRLQVSGDPGYQDYDRRVRVTVEESEFDVVVEPYEFGQVTGHMVNLDGSPVPKFNLLLKNAASTEPNAVVSSDEDGNFTIENAPAGELAFVSRATPSVLVRGVQLDPGTTVHVPLVLDWGEHEIRGMVVDRRGNPVPASRVVLKWAHHGDGISSSTIRRTAANAQGHFLFSQLGPGTHRLEIDAPGYGPVRLDHDASREGYDLLVRLN
jgi:hypothetical protein